MNIDDSIKGNKYYCLKKKERKGKVQKKTKRDKKGRVMQINSYKPVNVNSDSKAFVSSCL